MRRKKNVPENSASAGHTPVSSRYFNSTCLFLFIALDIPFIACFCLMRTAHTQHQQKVWRDRETWSSVPKDEQALDEPKEQLAMSYGNKRRNVYAPLPLSLYYFTFCFLFFSSSLLHMSTPFFSHTFSSHTAPSNLSCNHLHGTSTGSCLFFILIVTVYRGQMSLCCTHQRAGSFPFPFLTILSVPFYTPIRRAQHD